MRQRSMLRWLAPLCALALVATPTLALAQDTPAAPPTNEELSTTLTGLQFTANTVWTLIAGMLVFWMNAG